MAITHSKLCHFTTAQADHAYCQIGPATDLFRDGENC